MVALLWCCGVIVGHGLAKEPPLASLHVTGMGWWRDRELQISLQRLLGDARGETMAANTIEDAVFLVGSAVQADGFMRAAITLEVTSDEGIDSKYAFDAKLTPVIPVSLRAREIVLRVNPGVRFYVSLITLAGLRAIDEAKARSYWGGGATRWKSKASRAYTPARMVRAMDGVEAELKELGFALAEVRAGAVHLDEATGAVDVSVLVTEGERWRISAVRINGAEQVDLIVPGLDAYLGRPWTELLQQALAGDVRKALFALGYADARVRATWVLGEIDQGRRDVAIAVEVTPGERVLLGAVRFEGAQHVREEILRQRVRVKPEDPLNPIELEQARFRLARLGVFEKVELNYDPATGPVRSPVFTVAEGRNMEASLLFGYGTYEQARGGVELRQFNLLERAHQGRLRLVQSMKSTRGDYTYTVPEIWGEAVDGTAKIFGLQRDELSFVRQEYGANATLSFPVGRTGANATVGYTFQSLRIRDNQLASSRVDESEVVVASVDLGLTRDRRDNPLRPRRGSRWYAQVEAAGHELGGEAEFQRIEFGGSVHAPWGDDRWLHASFSHGVITTWGTSDQHLPVNKRFFPGGGNSIRGYREGEAAPRGGAGRFVGAKGFTVVSLDLEQALSDTWSVTVFGDGLATAAELRSYPISGDRLCSAGLGVRYQTLIGPIRIEYGRNLAPRVGDPGGTWQLSVGATF